MVMEETCAAHVSFLLFIIVGVVVALTGHIH